MAKDLGGTNSFLAARLRQARLQAGYSQQNIADALNVNRATYTYYETGKTSPDPITLGRIARICGAPIEFFFEDENDSFTPLYFTDRERCPKKPFPDPSKIGELTAEEKKLIALLRASQKVSAEGKEIFPIRQNLLFFAGDRQYTICSFPQDTLVDPSFS